MKRRTFLNRAALAAGAAALAPADLVFPGTSALSTVSDEEARAALDALRAERPCRAEVRSERGGPRLFLNGRETVPFWGLSTALLTGPLANYRGMGIDLIQPHLGMASAWTGPGQYDFRSLEAYLGRLLARHPGAYFFPRVQLQTPVWWKEAHPDETLQLGFGNPGDYWDSLRKRNTVLGEGDHRVMYISEAWEASFASDVWRRDTAGMLRAFVSFIEASPLVARMMGYFFVHGTTEEWNHPGDDWLPDYSAPMQRAAGPIPPPRERISAAYGLLRDPAREAATIAFYRRFHEVRAETIAHLAHAVKEACNRRVLTGTFFGYLMETPRIQESGHLAPDAVLESPDIDCVACPYTYQATNDPAKERWESDLYDGANTWLGRARGVGGDGAFRSMVESYHRRGKLYISEIDPATYLDEGRGWPGIGGSGHSTPEGTAQIIRRDLGNVLAAGTGGWFYDFGPAYGAPAGWYAGADVVGASRVVLRLMRARLEHDIGSVARVAVAGDAESFFATRHWMAERPWPGQGVRYTDFFNHWFLNAQARSLYRVGQPADLLYRTDLRAEDFRRYRLVLVPNTFLLAPADVDTLHERLAGSGCTVVWYYAPGLLRPEAGGTPGGVDVAQMERLTGFAFDELPDPGPLMIDALGPDGARTPFGIKSPNLYTPRFAVKGAAGGGAFETLGVWAGSATPALTRRAMDGWTSVYAGTAPLPATLLRRLAAEAGAAPWTDRPAVVTASRAGAMVVGQDREGDPGPLTVTFPFPMRDEAGGPARTVHTLPLAFGDVRLFTAA